MTAPTFTARDNVPDCTWQTEGDDLEWLCDASWDHIVDDHPLTDDEREVVYTHVACGEQRTSIVDMRWHIYMHVVMPVAGAEVGS